MTTYHPYKVKNSQLSGNDELMLTAQQINKINKAKSLRKGSDIKISKSLIRSVMREGLFFAVLPFVRSVAPTVAKTLDYLL